MVGVLGVVFYAVLIICAGVFFASWAGIALVLAIPLVVLVADRVGRNSRSWREKSRLVEPGEGGV